MIIMSCLTKLPTHQIPIGLINGATLASVAPRSATAGVVADYATIVDGMVRKLLAAREQLRETKSAVEALTGEARKLGVAAVTPIEVPGTVSALTDMRLDVDRMERIVEAGLMSFGRDLAKLGLTLKKLHTGTLLAEARADSAQPKPAAEITKISLRDGARPPPE